MHYFLIILDLEAPIQDFLQDGFCLSKYLEFSKAHV